MLRTRIITGLLFLPVFYLVTWKLSPAYFTSLILVAVAVGQYEFYRMVKFRNMEPHIFVGLMIGIFVVLETYHPFCPGLDKFLPAVYLILIMVARLFSRRSVDRAIEDVAVTFIGVVYVAILFSFQILIRLGIDGKQWVVFLYFVIWASDIGAYAIGIPFGKHRLYAKISPKKSVEGLIGALIASAGMALVCRVWFMPPIGVGEAAGIGFLLAIVGTIGDLSESLFKRAVGVKDSGGIIPGHGGILDRMDSMLFAAPALYYILALR